MRKLLLATAVCFTATAAIASTGNSNQADRATDRLSFNFARTADLGCFCRDELRGILFEGSLEDASAQSQKLAGISLNALD